MSNESSLRILVVEDEADLRTLFKDTLEFLGYAVTTCSNAEDAIQLTYELHPSLVFTDVVMPGMSGFELCKYLKNDLKTKDIFVVIVSALSREVDFEMSIQVGADDYLTKPVRLESIKKVLKNTISPFIKTEKWVMRQGA
ncbi:response regulator [Candidatus Bathyarchaeota archaeon]|jgi:CheY-like chemotaxis protein|nr:response regulator [Candidatus Bathyarchaeota archaeon]MBT4319588.1 response regulator [Candidatus Bathyarchaeota archaeon]MBT4422796.1 response regulator [Candidatus Bathyarchaeota archaeon]MBT5642663.1 response regulator [Candidatus Bathyarchaeota archaeon]MBT6603457.1 response regulator [Candidatus Bathyarchaeota archaeon]